MQDRKSGNVTNRAARILSVVFHPLFMPLYGLLIIFTAPTFFRYLPLRVKEILFLIVLVNNVLIPLSLVPFFRFKNIISSWVVESRRERIIPLLAASILFSITSFIMHRLPIALFLKAYFYSLAFITVFLLTINLWYRISLHAAGAGAMVALVLTLSLKMSSALPVLTVTVLLVSGLILSSRLKLNSHSPGEVYSGFLTGFFTLGAVILLFQ
jgi:hypothetical protein